MPVCDDRSILVAIQVDTVRPHVCLTTHGDTLSNFFLTLAVGAPSGAISCRRTISAVRREIAPLLAYEAREGEV